MKIILRALRQLVLVFLGLLLVIALIRSSPVLWRRIYPLSHQSIIGREAKRQKVDPSLVAAVINVESHWKSSAVSPKGASGLMQLMPPTAEWAAQQMGTTAFKQQDLFIPEVNIELGTWYLASLLREFDDRLVVAVAAYNGGQGNVENWLQQKVWDGTLANADQIPFTETRRYVKKVLNQYSIYSRLYSWDD